MKPNLWSVHVSSYVGISMGARHHYVKIKCAAKEVEIEQIMDEEYAAKLRTDDEDWGRPTSYLNPGQLTHRFVTREDCIAAALVVWEALKDPDDVLLIRHSYGLPEDGDVVAGPEWFVTEVVEIIALNESDEAWKRMHALEDRFADDGGTDEKGTWSSERAKRADRLEVTVRHDGESWTYVPDYDPWADEVYETLEIP